MGRMKRRSMAFVACVVAVPTLAAILPGFEVYDVEKTVIAGAALGLAYVLLRPILRILSLPIGCMTFGLFHFALDVALLYACEAWIGGFAIAGIVDGAIAALFVNAIVAIVGGFK